MKRKVITFLGKDPRDVVYEWQGKNYPARVMAQAIREFTHFDQMLVFVTPIARSGTFHILEDMRDDRIRAVDIVDGKDTESMWQIFQTVVDNVEDEEVVVFDITHGFRSLPFLAFLFVAYLRSAKNIKIEAVYYGAFEMQKDGKTPILDLTEFIGLFDWLNAVEQFVQTGNAFYMAKQLEENKTENIQSLAKNINDIALGIHLLRPRDIASESIKISGNMESATSHLPKPFGVVAGLLNAAYSQFGLGEDASDKDHLRVQKNMIDWYFGKQQFAHAISMSREWVVSFMCVELSLSIWDKKYRDAMESLLRSERIKDKESGIVTRDSPYLESWNNCRHKPRINKLWSGDPCKLADLRNDVMHSGFRKNPKPAEEIIHQIQEVVNEINILAQESDLIPKNIVS